MVTKKQRDEIRKDPIRLAIYTEGLRVYWRNRRFIRTWPRKRRTPAGHDQPDWV
jgi:hypothetical protein